MRGSPPLPYLTLIASREGGIVTIINHVIEKHDVPRPQTTPHGGAALDEAGAAGGAGFGRGAVRGRASSEHRRTWNKSELLVLIGLHTYGETKTMSVSRPLSPKTRRRAIQPDFSRQWYVPCANSSGMSLTTSPSPTRK